MTRESHFSEKDRELLIRMDEKVGGVQASVRDILTRIAYLEANKLDTKEANEWKIDMSKDIETNSQRLTILEKDDNKRKGALSAVQIGWGILITIVSLLLSRL